MAVISYLEYNYRAGYGKVKLARCSNERCTSATVGTVATTVDPGPIHDHAINDSGNVVIAWAQADDFESGPLKIATCSGGSDCYSPAVVATHERAKRELSLVISEGLPVVFFRDTAFAAMALRCETPDCSSASRAAIAHNVRVTSSAVAADGFPFFAYATQLDDDLVALDCDDPYCRPRDFGDAPAASGFRTLKGAGARVTPRDRSSTSARGSMEKPMR